MIKKYWPTIWMVSALILPHLVAAQANNLPTGHAVTFNEIDNILSIIINFVIGLSATIMVVSIVVSGIMIIMSRDNPKAFQSGLDMLKSAIWGSAVILGTGVILNTIYALVDRSFFCPLNVGGVCL